MRISPFSAQDQLAITTLGLEFAVAVALGGGVGFWADKKWDITPWATIAGVCLGFALGMYIVVKEARRLAQTPQKGTKRDRSL